MSIDTGASDLRQDVSLAQALPAAAEALATMLGLPSRPALTPREWIREGDRWHDGAVIDPERQAAIMLSRPDIHVMIGLDDYPHCSWIPCDDGGASPLGLGSFVAFVSDRPVGVVISVALALTVADLGGGRYWDTLYWEALSMMNERPREIPRHFAVSGGADLWEASVAWIRQFEPEWADGFRRD